MIIDSNRLLQLKKLPLCVTTSKHSFKVQLCWFHLSSNLISEWLPLECGCFFRKWWLSAGRTGQCALGKKPFFLLSNYCEIPESRATDGRAASRARFCRVVVVRCFCIALIQTENTNHTHTMLHGNELMLRCWRVRVLRCVAETILGGVRAGEQPVWGAGDRGRRHPLPLSNRAAAAGCAHHRRRGHHRVALSLTQAHAAQPQPGKLSSRPGPLGGLYGPLGEGLPARWPNRTQHPQQPGLWAGVGERRRWRPTAIIRGGGGSRWRPHRDGAPATIWGHSEHQLPPCQHWEVSLCLISRTVLGAPFFRRHHSAHTETLSTAQWSHATLEFALTFDVSMRKTVTGNSKRYCNTTTSQPLLFLLELYPCCDKKKRCSSKEN